MHPQKVFMQRAIHLAQENYKDGGHAVAAVIVKDDQIIAEAYTTIDRDLDPTAHAEVNAIRLAAKALQSKRLTDCYLYTTYEPCPMCTSACIWSKMKGIVYGASHKDRTKECPWRIMIPASQVIDAGEPQLELYPEFMREECKPLLSLSV